MWSVFDVFRTGDRSAEIVEKNSDTDSRQERSRAHRWAWISVLVFFVGGDLTTTALGNATPGVMEVNPGIVVLVDAFGLLGMAAVKAVVVVAAFLLYRVLARPHDLSVPLGFGVVGVGVTVWNLVVLTSVLFA